MNYFVFAAFTSLLISLGIITWDSIENHWLYSTTRRFYIYRRGNSGFPTEEEKSARANQSERLSVAGVIFLGVGALALVLGIVL